MPAAAQITTYFSAGANCGGGTSANFTTAGPTIQVSLCADTTTEGLCGATVYPQVGSSMHNGHFKITARTLSSGITDPSSSITFPVDLTNPPDNGTYINNFGGSRPAGSPNAPAASSGQVLLTFDISPQSGATNSSYTLSLDASEINTTTPATSCFAAFNTDPISATFTLNRVIAPVFTSSTSATFTVGSAGSHNVTATGTPTPTISLTSGSPPAAVTFSGGVLSGTPAFGTGAVGPYNLVFTATNAGGAPTQNFTLTVQKANQAITFNALSDRNQSQGIFGVSATAPTSPVTFASQTPTVCTTTGTNGTTVTPIAGGTCTIRASRGSTADYNAAADVDQSFTVTDDVAPNVNLTAQPSNPSNSANPSFSFSSIDVTATFECQLDAGGFSTCTSPKSYPGTADGSHTFQVRAKDSANNTSGPTSYVWTIDTVAPVVTIGSAPTINNANAASYTVTGTCENGLTVTVNVGGLTATSACASNAYSATRSVTGLSDSMSASISASQSDAAGNIGSANTTVVKDTVNPTVSITAPASHPAGQSNRVQCGRLLQRQRQNGERDHRRAPGHRNLHQWKLRNHGH